MDVKPRLLWKTEKGFSYVEVMIAAAVFALAAIPILSLFYQSMRNYVSAETYYDGALMAQNLMEDVKKRLDMGGGAVERWMEPPELEGEEDPDSFAQRYPQDKFRYEVYLQEVDRDGSISGIGYRYYYGDRGLSEVSVDLSAVYENLTQAPEPNERIYWKKESGEDILDRADAGSGKMEFRKVAQGQYEITLGGDVTDASYRLDLDLRMAPEDGTKLFLRVNNDGDTQLHLCVYPAERADALQLLPVRKGFGQITVERKANEELRPNYVIRVLVLDRDQNVMKEITDVYAAPYMPIQQP